MRRSETWKMSRSASSRSFSTSWPPSKPGDDVAADADEIAEERLPGRCRRRRQVRGGGRLFHQHGERGWPPTPSSSFCRELLRQRDEVHRLVPLEEGEHRVEDLPMPFLVEVRRPEQLHRPGQALALEENGPEHRSLGLHAVRGDLGGEQLAERGHAIPG
jgi:hypothetical protein